MTWDGRWFGSWLGRWFGTPREGAATVEVVGLRAACSLGSVEASGVSIGRRVGPGHDRSYPLRVKAPPLPQSVAVRDTVLLAVKKGEVAERKQRARGRFWDWRRMP